MIRMAEPDMTDLAQQVRKASIKVLNKLTGCLRLRLLGLPRMEVLPCNSAKGEHDDALEDASSSRDRYYPSCKILTFGPTLRRPA